MFCAETSELRKGGGGKIVDFWFRKIVNCWSWEEGLENLDCWFWGELIKGKLKLGGLGLRNGTRMFGCWNGLGVGFKKGGRGVRTRGGSLERVWTPWALSKSHPCLPWGKGTCSSGFKIIATLRGYWGFWFWPGWGTGAWFWGWFGSGLFTIPISGWAFGRLGWVIIWASFSQFILPASLRS